MKMKMRRSRMTYIMWVSSSGKKESTSFTFFSDNVIFFSAAVAYFSALSLKTRFLLYSEIGNCTIGTWKKHTEKMSKTGFNIYFYFRYHYVCEPVVE